jgi:hypothetical protein
MKNIREKIESGWIRCAIVIEVLGKPADYLDTVIKKTIEDLEKKKEIIEVISKKFYEPTPIESMFSTFTEVEILIKDMKTLTEFVFIYMPSNIEILEPKELKMNLHSANDFINTMAARMHQYDGIIKRIGFENKLLRHELEKLGKMPKQIKEMDKAIADARKDQAQSEEKKEK